MPTIVYEIIDMLAALLRLLGVAALGVGIGYLAVDLLRKAEGWPMQAVGFLGLAGLVIAMAGIPGSGCAGRVWHWFGCGHLSLGHAEEEERRSGIKRFVRQVSAGQML